MQQFSSATFRHYDLKRNNKARVINEQSPREDDTILQLQRNKQEFANMQTLNQLDTNVACALCANTRAKRARDSNFAFRLRLLNEN